MCLKQQFREMPDNRFWKSVISFILFLLTKILNYKHYISTSIYPFIFNNQKIIKSIYRKNLIYKKFQWIHVLQRVILEITDANFVLKILIFKEVLLPHIFTWQMTLVLFFDMKHLFLIRILPFSHFLNKDWLREQNARQIFNKFL